MRTAEQNRDAQIAAHMAYRLLPRRVFPDVAEVLSDFEHAPELAALSYFREVATGRGFDPSTEALKALRVHFCDLGSYDCVVIEYPRFPARDVLTAEPDLPPGSGGYVLAPYFSAILRDRLSDEPRYFVLGQSPDGGTRLREWSESLNTDHGPGCEPTLAAFLGTLKARLKGA